MATRPRERRERQDEELAFRVVFWEVPRRPMRVRPAILLVAAVFTWVLGAACSNQGEGEFCDTANMNNDCQDGLTCQDPAPGLVAMQGIVASRCCPADTAQATTAACMASASGLINAGGDAAFGDASVGDSAIEAESDALADATSIPEATTDAPHDVSSSTMDQVTSNAADATLDSGTDAGMRGDSSDAAPE